MTIPTAPDGQGSSTRPYLIRALHDWCTDNGYTPYIAVYVDAQVQVPQEYVKNNEIVLNVGFEATSNLKLGNEQIEFKARFGGSAREIVVPIDLVVAIYARENGQGMAFPVPSGATPTAGIVQAIPTLAPSVNKSTPKGPARPAAAPPLPARKAPKLSAVEPPAPDTPEPPPEPAPPAGARPVLKRIK